MIDKFVFVFLCVTGLFFCSFQISNGNIVLSMFFSFTFGLSALYLFTRLKKYFRKRSKKIRTSYANAVLDDWLFLKDEEAGENLMMLLKRHKTDNDQIEISLCPAASKTLNADWIFEIWKKHRNEKRVIAVSTGFADQSATQMCFRLKCPQVDLIDRKRLIDWIITETPCVTDEGLLKNQTTVDVRKKFEHLLDTVRPWRCIIYAALTFVFYLFFGRSVDLFLFFCLFAMAALAFRRKKHLKRE